jgi:hypothetical protein
MHAACIRGICDTLDPRNHAVSAWPCGGEWAYPRPNAQGSSSRRATASGGLRLKTNGCAEKAIQVLKEQLLWIERYDTLDELRTAVRAFGRTYNQHWLIERHGYLTPTEAREHLRAQAAATA